MATVTEIAPDIYRINAELPGAPITVSFFVIKDDQPTLVETGQIPAYISALRDLDIIGVTEWNPMREARN